MREHPNLGSPIIVVSNPIKDIGMKDIKGFATDVIESKKCKFCGSDRIVKNGIARNKQSYKCKECGHRFFMNESFVGMKTKGKVIATAMDLYFEGLSERKVQKQLRKIHGVEVSHQTIHNWIQKYSKLTKKFIDKLKPEFKKDSVWNCDETVLKLEGVNHWFYDAIEKDTRYIIDNYLSYSRDMKDTTEFFKKCKKVAKHNPWLVVTDSMQSYHSAFNKVFYTQHRTTRHLTYAGLTATKNNNRIERFHCTLKDRTKPMRGLGNAKSTKTLMDGFCVHYNFLRQHSSLKGKTPAQKAKINLPFEDGWGDMIYWSTVYQTKNGCA